MKLSGLILHEMVLQNVVVKACDCGIFSHAVNTLGSVVVFQRALFTPVQMLYDEHDSF